MLYIPSAYLSVLDINDEHDPSELFCYRGEAVPALPDGGKGLTHFLVCPNESTGLSFGSAMYSCSGNAAYKFDFRELARVIKMEELVSTLNPSDIVQVFHLLIFHMNVPEPVLRDLMRCVFLEERFHPYLSDILREAITAFTFQSLKMRTSSDSILIGFITSSFVHSISQSQFQSFLGVIYFKL